MSRSTRQFQVLIRRMALILALAALVAAFAMAGPVVRAAGPGELLDSQPGTLAAGVTPKLNAKLPLDAMVVNEYGTQMKLGEFFNTGKPVIFTLVYYSCPYLCTEELNNLVSTMKDKQFGLTLGNQFTIVTLSFRRYRYARDSAAQESQLSGVPRIDRARTLLAFPDRPAGPGKADRRFGRLWICAELLHRRLHPRVGHFHLHRRRARFATIQDIVYPPRSCGTR